MVILIPFFALAAYFLIRANPQRRRVQAQKTLVESLRPGTRVVTVAGVIGTIVGIEGNRAALEVAPGVIVEFLVAAIVRADEGPAGPSDDGDPAVDGLEPTTPGDAPDPHDPPAPHHEET